MALSSCVYHAPLVQRPCKFPKIDAINPELSLKAERGYLKLILAMPTGSMLDGGEGQKKCKELGQKIFDAYKENAGGCSRHGKAGAMKICNAIALPYLGMDQIRKQMVVYAWEGIGDSSWRWYFDPYTWMRDPDFRTDY